MEVIIYSVLINHSYWYTRRFRFTSFYLNKNEKKNVVVFLIMLKYVFQQKKYKLNVIYKSFI